MQKIRSHEWDVWIQGCRINGGRINEGRLYTVHSNYFFMYSIDFYCVTKKWAPHWLHSASGAESRRSPWKTVICIFICITLHVQYTLHMTPKPNTLMLTYLFNTTTDSPCVISWSLWSVDQLSTYHCVKNHWMKAIDHYQANLNYCSFLKI